MSERTDPGLCPKCGEENPCLRHAIAPDYFAECCSCGWSAEPHCRAEHQPAGVKTCGPACQDDE